VPDVVAEVNDSAVARKVLSLFKLDAVLGRHLSGNATN